MSSRTQPAKAVKKRSKACKRCLKRRQRCHGFPVCTRCEEANQPCEQSEYAVQLHSQDPSYASFQRIQALESQLASALSEITSLRQGQQSFESTSASGTVLAQHGRAFEAQDRPPVPWVFDEIASPLHQDVNYPAGSTLLPSQVASRSSQPSFAVLTGNDTRPFAHHKETNYVADESLDGTSPATSIEQSAPAHLQEKPPIAAPGLTPTVAHPESEGSNILLPTDAVGRRLLVAYFEKIHPRYPFLERSELFTLHAQRFERGDHTSQLVGFAAFKLYMVYAIGSTLLNLIDPSTKTRAEDFLAAALPHACVNRSAYSLRTIEEMTLLVLYNLRSSTSTGVWYMIGLAMRTCVDLDLHLESSYTEGSHWQNAQKRRLFWSVYVLERFIALSLRRPFSIAEHDIETRLPLEAEVLGPNDQTGSEGPSLETSQDSHMTMWIKLIQLKQFESRIQASVYCFNDSLRHRHARMGPLLASLDAWNEGLPPMSASDTSYVYLQWNEAVSRLLRPFLSTMRRDDPMLLRCLQASSQVCEVYKRKHQRESYGHSFVSQHSIFIAGLTMCYCLYLSPELYDNSVANSLRACSSTLFVIAERTPALRRRRDILDDIIGRIMDSPLSSGLDHSDFNDLEWQHCSRLDYVAVQSLLNLTAQQEPQEVLIV